MKKFPSEEDTLVELSSQLLPAIKMIQRVYYFEKIRARNQVKIGMKPPCQCSVHSRYMDYMKTIRRMKSWLILGTSTCIVPLTLILFAIDVNMEWVYLFMGISISSAVLPIVACLYWTSLTKQAMIVASVCGTIAGLTSWLIVASRYENGLENFLKNTGEEHAMVIGNVVAFVSSGTLLAVVTHFTTENSDQFKKEIWEETKDIDNPMYPWTDLYRKELRLTFSSRIHQRPLAEHIEKMFYKEKRIAVVGSVTLTFLLIFVCPISVMAIGNFSRKFFVCWITVSLIAAALAACYIVVVPLVDEILLVSKSYKRKNVQKN